MYITYPRNKLLTNINNYQNIINYLNIINKIKNNKLFYQPIKMFLFSISTIIMVIPLMKNILN
jgi:hypothetical protein